MKVSKAEAVTDVLGLSCRFSHSLQKRGYEKGRLGKNPTACLRGGSEGRGWAGQGLPRSPRHCPVRMARPEQRHHPEGSASVVGPPRLMAGGACMGVGLGRRQTPHQ